MRNLYFAIALTMTTAGCDRAPQPTFPVSGVVEWNDGLLATELAAGNVSLRLVDGGSIPTNPRGTIGSDGTFVLRTYEPGDGAPAGKYQAIVVPTMSRDDEGPQPKLIMDPRFQDYTTSGLEVEVKPEPSNEVRLTVNRAKKR
jgi:hypothetical protein